MYGSQKQTRHHFRWKWPFRIGILALAIFLLNLFLQDNYAHREPQFIPQYPQVDLSPLWEQETLSSADYDLILMQTGLAKPAVDSLLASGDGGIARIEETQKLFFHQPTAQCVTLIGGRFTCEDRLLDEEGNSLSSVPIAPLQDGDIIVTFSTHTFGWRHGHAGLVVNGKEGILLEAVMMFSDSAQKYAWHWSTYSNFIVLRVKDADQKTRRDVASFALTHLDQVPYRLTCGLFGSKAPDPQSDLGAHCAYLPWYAWQAYGYDLDVDKGRIVTVLDLAESPLLEVVQVCGINPAYFTSNRTTISPSP